MKNTDQVKTRCNPSMLFFLSTHPAVCSDRSRDAAHTTRIMQTPSISESMTEDYCSRYEDGEEVISSIYRQQLTPPFYHESIRSTAPNATSITNQTRPDIRQRLRPRLAPSGYAVTADNSAILTAIPPAIARDPRRKPT